MGWRHSTAALIGFAAVAALTGCSGVFRTTVVLSRDDLQARIEPRFPIGQEQLLGAVLLEHPKVMLDEPSSRVGLTLDGRVRLAVFEQTGKVGVLGRLSYDREQGQIFLIDPEITTLDIPGLPADQLDVVRQSITLVLASQLPRIPVHTLSGTKEQTMRAFIRSVAVRGAQVEIELGL